MARLQERHLNVIQEKDFSLCGKFIDKDHGCANKMGRPNDADMDFCDNWCCRQGYLTGKILKMKFYNFQ